jgi:hypothetical protein
MRLDGENWLVIKKVHTSCEHTDKAHGDFEPDGKPEADDERVACTRRCFLTGGEFEVKLRITLNEKKIAKGFFNPKTHDGKLKKDSTDDIPLDDESVRVHERSHATTSRMRSPRRSARR